MQGGERGGHGQCVALVYLACLRHDTDGCIGGFDRRGKCGEINLVARGGRLRCRRAVLMTCLGTIDGFATSHLNRLSITLQTCVACYIECAESRYPSNS